MSIFTNRIERESRTVEVMIQLYCKNHHGLLVKDCSNCSELQNYALDRLKHCPFHEGKTSCKNCPIHCYKPGIKDDIKQVMRYSGPRMLLRHPILTMFHFSDNRRKEPLSILTQTQKTELKDSMDCQGPIEP